MSDAEIEIIGRLYEFFSGDVKKIQFWLKTENLNFAGMRPISLINNSKEKRVLDFVKTVSDSNLKIKDVILENEKLKKELYFLKNPGESEFNQ